MAGFSAQVWIPDANDTVFCRLGNFLEQVTLRTVFRNRSAWDDASGKPGETAESPLWTAK